MTANEREETRITEDLAFRVRFENAFWVEQATGLLRQATSLPQCSAASCRRKRAGSPFHPFSKHTLRRQAGRRGGFWLRVVVFQK
ncbi:MAG: hypothetical protein FJ398_26445 [Verrucomicrobia bacterium]|nr:hypothetical protein [Verrucomicrobiota bacterium]